MEEINETHKNFLDLRDSFYSHVKPQPNGQLYGGMPLPRPVILESQLQALASDRQMLRTEIEELIRTRYMVLEIDYMDELSKLNDPVVTKFMEVVRNYTNTEISKEMLEKRGINEAEIHHLIDLKCLLLDKPGILALALPNFGAALSSITAGRKTLVNYLKRRPGKTQERFEVERRAIDASIFYGDFHCQDLIGLGVFEVTQRGNGKDQVHLVFDPYKK